MPKLHDCGTEEHKHTSPKEAAHCAATTVRRLAEELALTKTYVTKAQDIIRSETLVQRVKDAHIDTLAAELADLRLARKQDRDTIHKLNVELAQVNGTVDGIDRVADLLMEGFARLLERRSWQWPRKRNR